MAQRARILFLAEACTLAHVVRPWALASRLDPSRFEVTFAVSPAYFPLLQKQRLAHAPTLVGLNSAPSHQFLNRIRTGQSVFQESELRAYAKMDLDLLERHSPDVVVGDMRLSLAASAKVAHVPYVTLANAYWSPYAAPRYEVPDLPLTRALGVPLGQLIFDVARQISFALHTRPLNAVMKHYGLAPLGADLREIYTHADRTLYCDHPGLIPTHALPDHHKFIGPVLWAPECPLPNWWQSLSDDRPVIYLNMGSSGSAGIQKTILDGLSREPLQIVMSSGGKPIAADLPSNLFVADWLPGEQVAARASLVITNGGSLGTYQALMAGKPALGVPSNLDQFLCMHYMTATGAVRSMRTHRARGAALRHSVTRLLADSEPLSAAQHWSKVINSISPQLAFEQALAELLPVVKTFAVG